MSTHDARSTDAREDLDGPGPAAVVPLRRPPIRQATLVRSDVGHTFDVFVRTIGAWWPVQPFSAGGSRVRDVTVEPFVRGRVYETWEDGTVVDWGRLQVWEPPARFAMTWAITPAVTEVELTFTALGPSLTRVAVEHRGWEVLGDAELTRDCALPGGYGSGAYSTGWTTILAAFAATVGAADHEETP
jgi:Activator of Hsp90 ATPase homolog 1-like protein